MKVIFHNTIPLKFYKLIIPLLDKKSFQFTKNPYLIVNENPEQKSEESQDTYDALYKEYVAFTKQKFVIENILLEKAGYLPDKINNVFLGELVEQGRKSSKNPMYIYINTKERKEGEINGKLEKSN